MQKIAVRTSFLWLSSLLIAGCVAPPPPYEDYSLARTAVRAARDVDSARFSTTTLHKAEEALRNGEKAFKDNDFEVAKRYFKLAKEHAESAENATRLKKFRTGDSFP